MKWGEDTPAPFKIADHMVSSSRLQPQTEILRERLEAVATVRAEVNDFILRHGSDYLAMDYMHSRLARCANSCLVEYLKIHGEKRILQTHREGEKKDVVPDAVPKEDGGKKRGGSESVYSEEDFGTMGY